jgi:hypothetical protein
MNKKLLCIIFALHTLPLFASQKVPTHKKQAAASTVQITGNCVFNLALILCAASAATKTNAQDVQFTRVPLFNLNTTDCIPLALQPNILCLRRADLRRNQTGVLLKAVAIDNFYQSCVRGLDLSLYTQADYDYFTGLPNNQMNEEWQFDDGSTYRSLSYRYPALQDNAASQNNHDEFEQWKLTWNTSRPYQPDFIGGSLEYQPSIKPTLLNLVWVQDKEAKTSQEKAALGKQLAKKDNSRRVLARHNKAQQSKQKDKRVQTRR